MRKFAAMVVGVAVFCAAATLAQAQSTSAGTVPPGPGEKWEEHVGRAHRDAWILQHALMEAKRDPAVLPLVTQALTDRTTLLQAELDHVSKLQAVVTAIQGGDKEAIKTAREAAKASVETVFADAKIFNKDCKAIREQLHLEHPGHGGQPMPAPATTN